MCNAACGLRRAIVRGTNCTIHQPVGVGRRYLVPQIDHGHEISKALHPHAPLPGEAYALSGLYVTSKLYYGFKRNKRGVDRDRGLKGWLRLLDCR